MTSAERHEARYQRRKAKREENRRKRAEGYTLENVFDFVDMFQYGRKCCNGVRWKASTQNFERHLFSVTAKNRKEILARTWKPDRYTHFTVHERGKVREIDAPRIRDRQIHKTLTRKVLFPLYTPYMIYNNGASIKGKGLKFAYDTLKTDLRKHFKKYGHEGQIILLDFKKFFPTASHDAVMATHGKIIQNEDLCELFKVVGNLKRGDIDLPLGVELNQAEMVALPTPVDNYIKCQLHIKCVGHYMDDYYLLLPPDMNAREIIGKITAKAKEIGLTVNTKKVRTQRISKPFRFCKAKFTVTATGKIIVNGCRDPIYRYRRKLNKLKTKIENREMTWEQLRMSAQPVMAYYRKFNSHAKVLRAKRIFYAIFGFDPDLTSQFRMRDFQCGTSHTKISRE